MPDTEYAYCEKCNKTMRVDQFYQSRNTAKYPTGVLSQCKKCISMHIDNWNPDTYLWILQECDVPYVPDEWNKLLMRYGQDPKKVTGTTILGRYLAKMRLNQYTDFTWKDSQFLQDLATKKIKETMENQGFDAQQIAEAVTKASVPIPQKPIEIPQFAAPGPESFATGSLDVLEDDAAAPELDLTDEDKLYLRLKWGKGYKPEEWVQLEKFYNEMMASYDIQTAGHIDTLKLICKTSLKANQLIDIGDIDGYQKVSRVYDQLMKAGKFTAAQNKAENGEFIDSIGELVALCEKEGFIPRYYVSEPNDKVDETILDMQRYTKRLVMEETNLSQLLEDAIKTVQKEDAAENDNDDDEPDYSDVEEIEHQLSDEDYEAFDDYLEEQEINDELLTNFLLNEDR